MADTTENVSGLQVLDESKPKEETASVQIKNPKTAFGTLAGNVGVTPGPELLAKMQEYIDSRTGAMNTFVGGLKDASAVLHGQIPERERQKAEEAQSIFKMRADLATMQQAQEQTKRAGALTDKIMGTGMLTPGDNIGGQRVQKPVQLDSNVLERMALFKANNDPIGAMNVLNEFLKGDINEATKRKYNVEGSKQTTYYIPDANGNMQEHQLTPDQWDALPQRIKNRAINSLTGAPGAPVVTQGDSVAQPTAAGLIKNNNPGNIRFGDFAKSQGATGQDERGFAIFPDIKTGENAQHGLLTGDKYKGLSLKDIPSVWAPKGDGQNDPNAYAQTLQDITGFSDKVMGKKYGDLSPEQQALFRAAQKRIEHGTGLSAPSAGQAQPSAGQPSTAQTMSDYRQQQERQKALLQENLEVNKKPHEAYLTATNASTLSDRQVLNTRWENWINKNSARSDKILGLMNEPTLVNAVANVLSSGINTTQGNISMPGLEEAFQKMQKGVDKKDVEALQEIKQILEARILDVIQRTKGSSSDKDMDAFRTIAGSSKNGLDLIYKLQQYDKQAIVADKEDRAVYDRLRKQNKGVIDYSEYNSHPERQSVLDKKVAAANEISKSQYTPKKAPVRPTNVPEGAKYSPSTNTWWLNGKQVG